MSTSIANNEVRSYLEAVRTNLGDVPECDLEELLEDLEQHLLEVAAEGEGSLEERLGPPAAYAEDLRVTAGLPSRDAAERRRLSRRMVEGFERSALGRMIDTAARSKTAGALGAFLPELRPGWWILRGYLAIEAPSLLTGEWYGRGNVVVPSILGNQAAGLIATAAAIWLSVALGRSSQTQRNARRFSILLSAFVVVAAFAALGRAGNLSPVAYDQSYAEPNPFLHHADGTPISNICPYSTDGKPLAGVLLFDQDGRPIIDLFDQSSNGLPLTESHPTIRNAYPRALEAADPITGQLAPLECPSIPAQSAPAGARPVAPANPPPTK